MSNRIIPDEVKALGGGRTLPWTETLTLRPPHGPPKGLRLSQPCGSCCILDYFLERKSMVSDGVSLAGHLYADVFIQSLLVPVCMPQVEKEYNWADKGTSGMDTVVDPFDDGLYDDPAQSGDPYIGHYEYKTTSDKKPKPSKGNREQVIRQRVVMARQYGITDEELFNSYIFMISKEGKNTGRVYGPFLVEPTEAELKLAQRDIDLRVQVYDDIIEDGLQHDPLQHPLMRELRKGTCTTCFPLQLAEPSEEVLDIFNRGRDDWEDWVNQERLAKWTKDMKDKIKPFVPEGERVETPYFLIRHTESGRLYIDAKNLN